MKYFLIFYGSFILSSIAAEFDFWFFGDLSELAMTRSALITTLIFISDDMQRKQNK